MTKRKDVVEALEEYREFTEDVPVEHHTPLQRLVGILTEYALDEPTEAERLEEARAFMRLPLEERRRIFREQAEKAAPFYEAEEPAPQRQLREGYFIYEDEIWCFDTGSLTRMRECGVSGTAHGWMTKINKVGGPKVEHCYEDASGDEGGVGLKRSQLSGTEDSVSPADAAPASEPRKTQVYCLQSNCAFEGGDGLCYNDIIELNDGGVCENFQF